MTIQGNIAMNQHDEGRSFGMTRRVVAGIGALASWRLFGSPRPQIRIGGKDFEEQRILLEVIAQHVEHYLPLDVIRKPDLRDPNVELRAGRIYAYVEYSGTALVAVLGQTDSNNRKVPWPLIRQEYGKDGLEWFEQLGFEDTFALVMRSGDAKGLGIRSLSDAAKKKDDWLIAAGPEFQIRGDGLAGLVRRYGIQLGGRPLTIEKVDQLYSALEERRVDLIAANSTDGLLLRLPVVTLEDDLRFFPAYEAAIVARRDGLDKHVDLRRVIGQLSGRIDQKTIQTLNAQAEQPATLGVSAESPLQTAARVARDFLRGAKL